MVKFGRAKHFSKITLGHILKHLIQVSAHDDRHDEEYMKPVINSADVTEEIDSFAPFITFKVEGTELFGSGCYSHKDGFMFVLSLWDQGKWVSVKECEQIQLPASFISIPLIRGKGNIKFICRNPNEDRAYKID